MQDKLLKSKLSERFEGFGSTPSDAVWAGIEQTLDGDKRKGLLIRWFVTIAAILAIGLMTLLFAFSNQDYGAAESVNYISRENKNSESIKKETLQEAMDTAVDDSAVSSDILTKGVPSPSSQPAYVPGKDINALLPPPSQPLDEPELPTLPSSDFIVDRLPLSVATTKGIETLSPLAYLAYNHADPVWQIGARLSTFATVSPASPIFNNLAQSNAVFSTLVTV